jgi:hypothetical protein
MHEDASSGGTRLEHGGRLAQKAGFSTLSLSPPGGVDHRREFSASSWLSDEVCPQHYEPH